MWFNVLIYSLQLVLLSFQTMYVITVNMHVQTHQSLHCWVHSSQVLVQINMTALHRCPRFVSCTCIMWISCSTTFQRCSIGLRFADRRDRLSSCSRNEMRWSDVIRAWSTTILRLAQMVWPKVCQENTNHRYMAEWVHNSMLFFVCFSFLHQNETLFFWIP